MPAIQTPAAPLRIAACVAQHRGDRTEQQDRVAVFTSPAAPRHVLGVLADGVGGRSGARHAAETVLALSQRRFARFDPRHESPRAFFEALVGELHDRLHADRAAAMLDPHSTFAALLLGPHGAAWCHLGDSRIYRLRPGRAPEHTRDHTYERLLVEQHGLAPQQARRDPRAQRLVHSLGAAHCPRPSFGQADDLADDDCFVLCSDGVWSQLEPAEIAGFVHALAPREAAESMIAAARQRARGRGDNCSLALLRIGG